MTECLIANYSLIAVQFLFGNNMQTIYFKPLKGMQKSSLFQKKISALFKLNFFIILLKRKQSWKIYGGLKLGYFFCDNRDENRLKKIDLY